MHMGVPERREGTKVGVRLLLIGLATLGLPWVLLPLLWVVRTLVPSSDVGLWIAWSIALFPVSFVGLAVVIAGGFALATSKPRA